MNLNHTPNTSSNTCFTLSLVSSSLSASSDWELIQDCVTEPHFATRLSLQTGPPTWEIDFRLSFIFEKADWPKFSSLSGSKASQVIDLPEVDEFLPPFVNLVTEAATESIPVTRKDDKVPPWECWFCNDACREAKSKLHKAAKRNGVNIPGSRQALGTAHREALAVYSQAKHEKWNEICRSFELTSCLSSQWRRLRWIYNGGIPPQRALVESVKALADDAMAFFLTGVVSLFSAHPPTLSDKTEALAMVAWSKKRAFTKHPVNKLKEVHMEMTRFPKPKPLGKLLWT